MKCLGELFIDGRAINLDSTEIDVLEKNLQAIQNEKKETKFKLDSILEEIYN